MSGMSICFAMREAVEWILHLDPVFMHVGPLEIRWYALSYVFGILFAHWHITKASQCLALDKKFLDSLMLWAVIGIILGGRTAYILLYNPSFYWEYPSEILQTWHGGMSMHGGYVGCIIAVSIVCKKHRVRVMPVLDLCACAAPLGLFLGRMANLVNGELYGRATTTCLGVVFPSSGDLVPRHPSQVYEAMLEGLLPLLFMSILARYTKVRLRFGVLSHMFGAWYGIVRCAVEFFREPDPQVGYIAFGWLTMGQVLSAPIAVVGIFMLVLTVLREKPREGVADISA
ncbi:prolipoprotein diacylglyceryl transferase [Anaplasma marginale]|uniref:Phosphatidylglycerol--prolipoprotein diacylglyceryl transferase n=4 Tax=Anaplasma marginale TaxID=770 RepID=LGT_ANAMF|nr:prolipoprotein diacylglyceryl transferase [Anaplasma marginale]B9KH48.1 RecName: Full=Phosphatidylglycerol--prolipoprotein diacylglyceryl transferase [Anaplasma marginale str. Florida]Q5P9I4.1 RecName: Full=Phosphatidylglycerol--prolipoprotein diacylglyceryl transferase [Anaplasma marginale str. St. Maries]AAV87046.1 prolipoprotein diacylglyceryl transferase [Anaplasma marginale str. St. Maries]ACM49752.1 prolipoprotein diacylglyceryl transferase (lgt) [Anaplasma marginale str. Florida]AHW5